MGSFLKRNKLYETIAVYLGSSWVLIEASSYFIERFSYPEYYVDIIILLLVFGLISVIVNEWRNNLDAEDRKSKSQLFKGIYSLIVLVALISAYYLRDYSVKNKIQLDKISSEKVSIAVLPFKNISPDKDNEWISDGLSDQIIDQLNHIKSIDVKSRSASFYFKDKDYHPVQIAKLLGVNTLLDGSVLVLDSLLRISIKLINPSTGSQLWSEKFDRPLSNILSIQTEIAITIARKINAEVTAKEQLKMKEKPTNSVEAYEAYMKGKYHFNLVTVADNKRAHDYFLHAIELDPTMAKAYAYLGLTYDMFGGYWLGLEPDSAYRIIDTLANKALQINPNLALGHFLRANYIFFYERNYIGGLHEAEKAYNLADTKEDMIWLYCVMLSVNNKADEAISVLKNYIKNNPTSPQAYQGLCLVKLMRDMKNEDVPTEEFFEPCNKAMELDPGLFYSKYYLAEILFFRKEFEASKAYWEELVQITPAPHFIEGLSRLNYYLGDTAMANQYFNQLKLISKQQKIPYVMARAYSNRGDVENALKYLEEAYEYRDIEMVNLWFDPNLDSIRHTPEFKEILSRLNYAGDQ